jgi:predicted dinucleotide-binding enzyme
MKIGTIGAGTVAQTIARHVLPLGHQVMLSNTQGPDSLAPLLKKLGPGAGKGFYSRIWKGFVTKAEGISDAATHGDQGLIGLRIWRR